MSQEQDFSKYLTIITPQFDILSYYPDRELYWVAGVGRPPFINKSDQPINSQILQAAIKRSEAHCRLLDMSIDADKNLYEVIKNRVLQGWYRIAKDETHWDAENRKMLIWLEWIQDYLMHPPVNVYN